jgi:hypothetical protein
MEYLVGREGMGMYFFLLNSRRKLFSMLEILGAPPACCQTLRMEHFTLFKLGIQYAQQKSSNQDSKKDCCPYFHLCWKTVSDLSCFLCTRVDDSLFLSGLRQDHWTLCSLSQHLVNIQNTLLIS